MVSISTLIHFQLNKFLCSILLTFHFCLFCLTRFAVQIWFAGSTCRYSRGYFAASYWCTFAIGDFGASVCWYGNSFQFAISIGFIFPPLPILIVSWSGEAERPILVGDPITISGATSVSVVFHPIILTLEAVQMVWIVVRLPKVLQAQFVERLRTAQAAVAGVHGGALRG